MNVTRNVIIDLLPLYLAGEASKDTRQLVKAYLETDSSLTKLTEMIAVQGPIEDISYSLNKEQQLKTLEKMKRYTQQRNLFMSTAFLFTGLLLAFRFEGESISWLWGSSAAAIPVFLLALFGWIGFAHSVRRLAVGHIEEMKVQQNVFLGLALICSLLFTILLRFSDAGPRNMGILYFLLFFAFVGWVGYANAIRRINRKR